MSQSQTLPQPSISIFPLLLVNFIGMMGYSIIMPFLVFLVQRFGGNEVLYGVIGSVYPFFQFIGAPILGKWSDKYGRKRILFLSQAGTLIAWILFIVAILVPIEELLSIESSYFGVFTITIPLIILVSARALDGLTGGNISVANAYMADISTDKTRKANFGKMGVASSLGFIVGPAIAGILGATVYQELLPVAAAALISTIALFLIRFYLPESKSELVDPDTGSLKIAKTMGIEPKECYEMENCPETSIWKIPRVPYMIMLNFMIFLGFNFFYAGFPIHASKALGWDSFQLGVFFSFLSVMMVLVQGPVLSYVSGKVSDTQLVLVGALIMIFNFLLMASGVASLAYLAAVFFALGNGLMWPSFLSVLARIGGKEKQGAVQGAANSAGSLASIFGLIGGGFLYSAFGGMAFVISAVFMVVIAILAIRILKWV